MVDASLAGWVVILLALVGANLPFVNQKVFVVLPAQSSVKSFWWRLVELVVMYWLVGLVAYFFEQKIGTVFDQRWEFFAITACLFVVLAFPGFAFQYLRKRHVQS